ncbi:hypothetical protein FHG87_002799 [Trinorchestia longiramus]|nr:hypothetical protein FHG87_002799 [Trinorchestia longiramus]
MCCCCDKRTGHLVIVWFHLIYYIIAFIVTAVETRKFEDPAYGVLVACAVISFIMAGMCILDIYAIHDENASLMLPFFIWMIINTIFSGLGVVVYIVAMIVIAANGWAEGVESFYGMFAAGIILSLLWVALYSYFCHVIKSHRKEVLAKEVAPLQLKNLDMRSRRESWTV